MKNTKKRKITKKGKKKTKTKLCRITRNVQKLLMVQGFTRREDEKKRGQ
jgi:hypothetical protein